MSIVNGMMAITPYCFDIVSLLGYNGCMKVQERVDIIAKKLDIVKSKAIGFMAISGGSWVYAIKVDHITILSFVIWFVFALGAYGTIVNFLKMGELYKDLERIENDSV